MSEDQNHKELQKFNSKISGGFDLIVSQCFERMDYRPTVSCFISNQNKEFLVVRRPNSNEFYPIQGGCEHGETIKDTCKREIAEELGINRQSLIFSRPISSINIDYENDKLANNDNFKNGKLYILCLLFFKKSISSENLQFDIDPTEIADIKWIEIEKYFDEMKTYTSNKSRVFRIWFEKLLNLPQ